MLDGYAGQVKVRDLGFSQGQDPDERGKSGGRRLLPFIGFGVLVLFGELCSRRITDVGMRHWRCGIVGRRRNAKAVWKLCGKISCLRIGICIESVLQGSFVHNISKG